MVIEFLVEIDWVGRSNFLNIKIVRLVPGFFFKNRRKIRSRKFDKSGPNEILFFVTRRNFFLRLRSRNCSV